MVPPPAVAAPTMHCGDDPNYTRLGEGVHGCSWVALKADIRCSWKEAGGVRVDTYCRKSCQTCPPNSTTDTPDSTNGVLDRNNSVSPLDVLPSSPSSPPSTAV